MAQWITDSCLQAWWPEFYYPQESYARRREPTPLIYLVFWHLHAHHGTQRACMHAYTQSTQSMFITNQTLRVLARWVRFQIHTAQEGNRRDRLSSRCDCFFCNQQSLFMKPLQFCFYRQANPALFMLGTCLSAVFCDVCLGKSWLTLDQFKSRILKTWNNCKNCNPAEAGTHSSSTEGGATVFSLPHPWGAA